MNQNSVHLHQIVKATPEKIYRAFTHPDAMAAWIPPNGYLCQVHHMDVSEGGTYKMSFINFTTGNGHSMGGKYIQLIPNEYLHYSEVFDDPNLPGEMLITVTLKKVICGTEINIKEENIPSIIPIAMCYLGWQESLEKLKKLVEPEIPDA